MSAEAHEPFPFSLNGDPATGEELRTMEELALDIIRPVPAELSKQYGYDVDGSIVLFGTTVFEAHAINSSVATIMLSENDYDNVKFELSFDYDNNFSHLYFPTKEELSTAARIAQTLLDADALNPTEHTLITYLQNIVFCTAGIVTVKKLETTAPDPSGEHTREVGDVIRKTVAEKAPHTIKVKNIQWPLSGNSYVRVLTHEVLDGDPDESNEWVPALQIEFQDEEAGLNYCYVKCQDGTGRFDTLTTADLIAAESKDDEMTAEDEEIEALMGYASTLPGTRDVSILTEKLLEAALLSLSPLSTE